MKKKATGMKKPVSTKRGDDKRPSKASVKKSLGSPYGAKNSKAKLAKVKF